MNRIVKRFLSIALMILSFHWGDVVYAAETIGAPKNGEPQRLAEQKKLDWKSMNTLQMIFMVGVPSAVALVAVGGIGSHLYNKRRELSVVLVGEDQEIQGAVVDYLCRQVLPNGKHKVADVLSGIVEEKEDSIDRKARPTWESSANSDKWNIHSICVRQDSGVCDNPQDSELIRKADVIVVVAQEKGQRETIYRLIRGIAKGSWNDSSRLVVHARENVCKNLKNVTEKIGIAHRSFFVKSVNITNCQQKHEGGDSNDERGGKLEGPYRDELVRKHLNEALSRNQQGVVFNDSFFKDCVSPLWRGGDVNQDIEDDRVREMIRECELDKLKIADDKGDCDFSTYLFEPAAYARMPRLYFLKSDCAAGNREYYNMFLKELLWINENKEFLNQEDLFEAIDLQTRKRPPYKNRLILTVSDLHNKCVTEFKSFIESWGAQIDELSLIKQKKQSEDLFSELYIAKRIVTNVRMSCLEDFVRVAAMDLVEERVKAGEGNSRLYVPEIEQAIRRLFETALNVPDKKLGSEVEIYERDVVYFTNVLSTIMNIEAIAAGARDFAKKFDLSNQFEPLFKKFDDTISYVDCCKILDRSARYMLKNGEQRSFDERFRAAVKELCTESVDPEALNLFCDWINGEPKSFGEICNNIAAEMVGKSYLPEVYSLFPERFGNLTFIKYLIDQQMITLPD